MPKIKPKQQTKLNSGKTGSKNRSPKPAFKAKPRKPVTSTPPSPKHELLYGLHAVEEALKARRREIYAIMVAKDIAYELAKEHETLKERFARVLDLAHGTEIEYVSSQTLERLTRSPQHQGIAAKVSPLPETGLDEILDTAEQPCRLLLLDGITDPHNLGALMRTALCAGFAAVVIPKDRAAEATATVAKVSSGALEYLPLVTVTNLVNTIKELKSEGFWVAGLAADADGDIYATDMRGDFALVVGSEGKGLRPLVREACDLTVSIPQEGPLDSLNASVAGSLAIYEIYRQNHYPAK